MERLLVKQQVREQQDKVSQEFAREEGTIKMDLGVAGSEKSELIDESQLKRDIDDILRGEGL